MEKSNRPLWGDLIQHKALQVARQTRVFKDLTRSCDRPTSECIYFELGFEFARKYFTEQQGILDENNLVDIGAVIDSAIDSAGFNYAPPR